MADQTSVILERANSAIVARDFTYAEKLLMNLLRQNPDTPEALELLGSVYLRADRFENALSIYKKLSEIHPGNAEILSNLGSIYRRLGKYEESIAALLEAKKTGDDVETVLYNLGNTYKQMGNYAEAALCFSDVIEQKPDDVLAYNHLGSIHALSGRHDLALQAYRRGLQIDPNHPFIHYNMAHSYETLGRPSEAAAEYNAALKTKPGWLDALHDLASLYMKQKDEQACVATLRRILAVDPVDVRALVEMGGIAGKSGRNDDALAYFRKAIANDPSNVKAVLGLVQIYEKQGQFEEAVAELKSLQATNPKSVEILVHLARILLRLQQYPEAKTVFRQIEAIDPDNLAALRLQGRMYAEQGENEQAELCFTKILAIDPAGVDFRIDLAEQLIQSGKLPEAEEQILAYLVERPRDFAVRISLGQLYESMKDPERALATYKDVLASESENIDALTALSLLYQRTGRNAEAVRLADDIVNMQGSRGSEEDLGKLSNSLDLYEKAVQRYGSSNPDAIGRNLKLLRSQAIPDAEEPLVVAKQEESFIPVDEENDSAALSMEDEIVGDDELPFDELMTFDETPEDETGDETLDDLVNLEEPVEAADSFAEPGFGPDFSSDADEMHLDDNAAEKGGITEEEEILPSPASAAYARPPEAPASRESPVQPRRPAPPRPEPPAAPRDIPPDITDTFLGEPPLDLTPEPVAEPESEALDLTPAMDTAPEELDLSPEPEVMPEPDFAPEPEPVRKPDNRKPVEPEPFVPEPEAPFGNMGWPPEPQPCTPAAEPESISESEVEGPTSSLMDDFALSQPEEPVADELPDDGLSFESAEEPLAGLDFSPEIELAADEPVEPVPEAEVPFDETLPAGSDTFDIPESGLSLEPEAAFDTEFDIASMLPNEAAPESPAFRVSPFPLRSPLLPNPRFDKALAEIPPVDLLDLFSYLKQITLSLPDRVLAEYLLSDERIQLEYIIERLAGRPGIKDDERVKKIRALLGTRREALDKNGDGSKIAIGETLEFLESMASALPDQGIAVTMKKWLEDVRGRYSENGKSTSGL
jgi:tetratricopeptide (TPR) repeat protein